MKLITILKKVHGNEFYENILYAGGMKKFLSNYTKKMGFFYIVNIVELGDVTDEELSYMISDGFKYMDSSKDGFDTLYSKV